MSVALVLNERNYSVSIDTNSLSVWRLCSSVAIVVSHLHSVQRRKCFSCCTIKCNCWFLLTSSMYDMKWLSAAKSIEIMSVASRYVSTYSRARSQPEYFPYCWNISNGCDYWIRMIFSFCSIWIGRQLRSFDLQAKWQVRWSASNSINLPM